MSELSREQIEKWRFWLLERRDSLDVAREANALCDLALCALSDHAEAGQPQPEREGLTQALKAWRQERASTTQLPFPSKEEHAAFAAGFFHAHPPTPRATEQACQHKRQKWAINMQGGHCMDCGVELPPSPKEKE